MTNSQVVLLFRNPQYINARSCQKHETYDIFEEKWRIEIDEINRNCKVNLFILPR